MIQLGTKQVALSMSPVGGRIVSLVDLRSRRDWVHNWSVDQPEATDDIYDASTASGWDECLPTVAASVADCPPWGRLRDHGEVWGRPADVIACDAASCTVVWSVGQLELRRTLRLVGERIDLVYRHANHGEQPLPWLYSQHALLAVKPGDRIVMTGIGALSPAWTSGPDFSRLPHEAEWPDIPTGPGDFGHSVGAAIWAAKLFAPVARNAEARLVSAEGSISFRWQADSPLRHLGLWLNHGGWPMGGGLHHLAFEPATCAFDGLADAVANDAAPILAPGQETGWTITVGLHQQDSGSEAGVR